MADRVSIDRYLVVIAIVAAVAPDDAVGQGVAVIVVEAAIITGTVLHNVAVVDIGIVGIYSATIVGTAVAVY